MATRAHAVALLRLRLRYVPRSPLPRPFRSHALSIPEQIRALERARADRRRTEDLRGAARAGALHAGRPQVGHLQELDDKLATDRGALAAMDKTRGELVARRPQHEPAARALAREAESRRAPSARRTPRSASSRSCESWFATARTRSASSRRTPTRPAQQIEATEAEHKKLVDELGSREGDISSKLGEVGGRAKRKQTRARCGRQALPAGALPPLRDDPLEARHGHRADDRRHLQGVQHGAPAAALSPPSPRAASSSSARRATASSTSLAIRSGWQRTRRAGGVDTLVAA